MCRLLVFAGVCTCCGEAVEWRDLEQQLSCLEAKNAGAFGECARGVQVEEHEFDQECDGCAEADLADEGFGDFGEGVMLQAGGGEKELAGGARGDRTGEEAGGGGGKGKDKDKGKGKGKGKERQRDEGEQETEDRSKRRRVS